MATTRTLQAGTVAVVLVTFLVIFNINHKDALATNEATGQEVSRDRRQVMSALMKLHRNWQGQAESVSRSSGTQGGRGIAAPRTEHLFAVESLPEGSYYGDKKEYCLAAPIDRTRLDRKQIEELKERGEQLCGLHTYSDTGDAEYSPQQNILELIGSEDVSMRECTPIQNMHFVKTQKTGGSTVSGMLLRYVTNHDIQSVVVPQSFAFVHWHHCTPTSFMKRRESEPPYNFHIMHSVWHRCWPNTFMRPERKVITILRDPIARFVSAFNYHNYKNVLWPWLEERNMPLDEQLHVILTYHRDELMTEERLHNNQLSWLGRDSECGENPQTAAEIKEILRQEYDLVMLTERFEESMVLLQHEMCWSLSDIIYASHKVVGAGNAAHEFLWDNETEWLREWLADEYEVYNYAVELFENRLLALPACGREQCGSLPMCFEEHVQLFKDKLEEVRIACGFDDEQIDNDVLKAGWSSDGKSDLENTCHLLALDSQIFLQNLKKTLPKMVHDDRYKADGELWHELVDGWAPL